MKLKLFPLEWVINCIDQYTQNSGKKPKILVLAVEDYIDYKLTGSLVQANQLDIQITVGSYLQPDEIDLAMEIKK